MTFNPTTLKCERYIYGGCGATANLYHSQEQCMATCYFGNPLPMRPTPRGVVARMGPMRTPMSTLAVKNPTSDAVVVEHAEVCKMAPVTPHLRACLAFIQKWTFDYRCVRSLLKTFFFCNTWYELSDRGFSSKDNNIE